MSLTRSMLKAMGIETEKIEEIIAAHSETVDALKAERDDLREKSAALSGIQKELEDLKSKGSENWQEKFEKEHSDFEAYKADQAKKTELKAKEDAYRAFLKDVGVSEKRIDAVLKVTDVAAVQLDVNGKIKDEKSLAETVKSEWSDFIVTEEKRGAEVKNPPENPGSKNYDAMSDADYYRATYEASKKK